MHLEPGTYRATATIDLTLKRSNSSGSRFNAPATISYRILKAGETFDVPETLSPFYYTSEATGSEIERI